MKTKIAGIMFFILGSVLLSACGSKPAPTPTSEKATATMEQFATATPSPPPPTETVIAEPPTVIPNTTSRTTAKPTQTPSTLSTDTPFLMCTPPACQAGEVYYCPGDCPGGCGSECATPTPTAAAIPVILSFTADRTSLVEGESVSLSWQASGGTEAYISWVGANGLLAGAPGPLDPHSGAVTVEPTGDGDLWLTVYNEAGSAEVHLQLDILCAYTWAPALVENPPYGQCPGPATLGAAAQQPFEGGFMLWFAPDDLVYVFYDAGRRGSFPTYSVYPDEFVEGDPESDPTIVPPAGLLQPVRGFGLVWRADPTVREGLGWATAPESGFETWRQGYQGMGLHNSYMLLQGSDGAIYKLTAMGGVWEVYSP